MRALKQFVVAAGKVVIVLMLAVQLGCQGIPDARSNTTIRANDSAIDGAVQSAEQNSANMTKDETPIAPAIDVADQADSEGNAQIESDFGFFAERSQPFDVSPPAESPWLKSPAVSDWWNVQVESQTDWLEDRPWSTLWGDQKSFYSASNIRALAGGIGIAAALANSPVDRDVSDWYQAKVRNDFSDRLSSIAKPFGEQWQVLSVYVAASILGRAGYASPRAQEWGENCVRSMLVGVPPLLIAQKAIGSSRPSEPDGSDWQFWSDSNGVSGHAFVGAVPFMIAARLSDHRASQFLWMAASTLPAWSRVNDNDHYLSQAVLGWWLAEVVTHNLTSHKAGANVQVTPWSDGQNVGVGLDIRR
jgi:hypothetical protein